MRSEADLYEPVRGFLAEQGFEVHAEVRGCDVVGRRGEDLVVVELKRQLSLELLAQGVRRQQLTGVVYLAVRPLRRSLRNAASVTRSRCCAGWNSGSSPWTRRAARCGW